MDLNNLPEKTKLRWELLKQDGKFNEEAALVSCTPVAEQVSMGKCIESVLKNALQLPTITELIKYQGEEYTKALIIGSLNLLSRLAVKMNTLTDEETKLMLVDMIVEKYPNWKFIEIRNVMKMAMMNEFGIIYDRIDPSVVFEWFGKYELIRLRRIEDDRLREKIRMEKEPIHKEVAGKLSGMFKANMPPRPIETKKYIQPIDFIKDPANQLIIEQWQDEYNYVPKTVTIDDYLLSKAITLMSKVK